jgi:hypothetical protein
MDLTSLNLLVAAIRAHAPAQRLIVFGSGSLLASFPDLGLSMVNILTTARMSAAPPTLICMRLFMAKNVSCYFTFFPALRMRESRETD